MSSEYRIDRVKANLVILTLLYINVYMAIAITTWRIREIYKIATSIVGIKWAVHDLKFERFYAYINTIWSTTCGKRSAYQKKSRELLAGRSRLGFCKDE